MENGIVLDDFHEGGCYIDDSFDYTGFFAASPPITLRKGSYIITFSYETNSDEHYYRIASKYNEPEIIEHHEMVYLSQNDSQVKLQLNPQSDIQDFSIRFYYEDDGYFLLNSIEIKETNTWKQVRLVSGILLLILFNTVCMIHKKRLWYRISPSRRTALLGIIVITALSSIPLLSPFALGGEDLKFHLVRIEELKNELLKLQLPVRMQGGWLDKAGYPVSILYSGDLFLSFPAIMRICGFSVIFSYNCYIFIINLITTALSYYSFRNIFHNNRTGLICSLMYTLAPYRLTNIYMRAAVGEYTAYAFFPLIALGLYNIFTQDTEKKNYKYSFIIPALGFTGLIQSHTLSCEIAGFFTILVCIFLMKKTIQPKRFFALAKVVLCAIFLNFGFLIPFLDYMRGTYKMNYDDRVLTIQSYGLFPSQLFSVFPQSIGGSPKISRRLTGEPFMPTSLGIQLYAGVVIFIYALTDNKGNKKLTNWRLCVFCFVLGFLALCMTTCFFPWDAIYKMGGFMTLLVKSLQFPWRLLGIGSLFLVLAVGSLIMYMQNAYTARPVSKLIPVLGICTLVSAAWFYSSLQYNSVYNYFDSLTLDYNNISTGEFLPAVTSAESLLNTEYPYSSPSVTVHSYEHASGHVYINCSNDASENGFVDVGLLSYPHYKAVDARTGQRLPLSIGDNGVIRINLSGNYTGSIHVFFQEPPLWRASELASLMTILFLLLYLQPLIRHKQ